MQQIGLLMPMCEPLNLIISRLHCWAVKLKAAIKRSEVRVRFPAVWQCCMHDMSVCCPVEKENLSSATCLIAVKCSNDDTVPWLSMLALKNPTADIMADMVNADCVHIRWLDAFCPVLVMFGAHSWLLWMNDSLLRPSEKCNFMFPLSLGSADTLVR